MQKQTAVSAPGLLFGTVLTAWAHTASAASREVWMSLAEQLFSIQDSTLSTKAELEQRHCSSLALQLPVLALPMQFSAQAGLEVRERLEGIELKKGILGRD